MSEIRNQCSWDIVGDEIMCIVCGFTLPKTQQERFFKHKCAFKKVKITMDRARAEIMKREHALKSDQELEDLCYKWSELRKGDTFKFKIKKPKR